MIPNPQVMDDLRELQGCIHAFLNHKAVLATIYKFQLRFFIRILNLFSNHILLRHRQYIVGDPIKY